MESHVRSFAKAVTWRLFGLVFTTGVVWVATGRPVLAVSVGLTEAFLKTMGFYAHERIWNRIDFGRAKESDYQI